MTQREHSGGPHKRGRFAFAVIVLMLALSVFGWGLSSKLSVYHARTAVPAAAPTAKLLSQRERASVQVEATLSGPLLLAVLLCCPLAPRAAQHRRPALVSVFVPPVAFCYNGPALLRPPPSHLA